jgi:hypothetical protein
LRGRRHDFLLASRDDQRSEPHIRQCPLTINLRDDFRLNVNAGLLRDTTDDANHLTWGERRIRAGLRYSPIKAVDVDLIYGHNLIGERANWITLP